MNGTMMHGSTNVKFIHIIGSAALEEARKLLTSVKTHKFTREKKIRYLYSMKLEI